MKKKIILKSLYYLACVFMIFILLLDFMVLFLVTHSFSQNGIIGFRAFVADFYDKTQGSGLEMKGKSIDEINDENGPDRSYEHRYDSKYVLEAVDKVAEIYEYFMSFCLILLILTWFSVRFWQVCRKKLRASNSAK